MTQISPITASPVEKSTLTITGTNFGADVSAIKVQLTGPKTYSLGVNAVTNTAVTCTLGGGVTGQYSVKVTKGGVVVAISNPVTATDFTYEMVITSISPSVGSKFGGTAVTIQGRGFPFSSTDLAAVILGDVVNNYCEVKTTSLTELVCVTPKMAASQALATAYKLTLFGRLIE